ncbi:M10 family metallopeptidase C-terminal domain-containing protein [Fertoebacter nigrum]|uniref:M10 family metallopeptidase C-terminal domain-containing protein n=1 Tax=Fertoeibacter niger TaxID=2656921 RepID=A0A8X8H5T6_9RHOB|nr:calcium-binding protein [Fertoeibacter niger]NUB46208.1 M10 family metallopeptidase C-terminal domain-containing protein [Fertoeibacter niger]
MPNKIINLEPLIENVFKPVDGLIDFDYEVHGGTKDDTIWTLDGNDLIFGGGGHDDIWSKSGSDTIHGGAGNDKIVQANFTVLTYEKLVAYGDEGDDTLSGWEGDDSLFGGWDNDLVEGWEGANYLSGGNGNDTIIGGFDDKADTMVGGIGDDVFVLWDWSGDKVVEDPTGGHDTLIVQAGAKLTLADYVEDLIVADAASEYNNAYKSDDLSSVLTGNWMANTIISTGGWDTLKGGTGDDTLKAGAGHDKLYGGADDDELTAGTGNDTVYGDSGYDVVYGGSGADQIYGGAHGDTLRGGADNDTLWGNDDDDKLFGEGGTDQLFGGGGHDSLVGSGNDSLFGGAGNDTYNVDASAKVIEGFDGGIDTVLTDETYLTLAENVERLYFDTEKHHTGTGNALANVIEGSWGENPAKAVSTFYGLGGNDTLNGGNGNDKLYGGADHDTLNGGNDDDRLDGGTGNDALYGGAGNDALAGGAGQDKLYGGEGADRFVFYAVSDSTGATYDKVVGFDFGADKIDLSFIDANTTLAGNQTFNFTGDKPFFTSAGDLWTEVGGAGIKIFGDINGDGVADLNIVVYGIGNPYEVDFQGSDFIL